MFLLGVFWNDLMPDEVPWRKKLVVDWRRIYPGQYSPKEPWLFRLRRRLSSRETTAALLLALGSGVEAPHVLPSGKRVFQGKWGLRD